MLAFVLLAPTGSGVESLLPHNITLDAQGQPWEALVWWDRHAHLNGGVAVRDMMVNGNANGDCLYWGRSQSTGQWSAVLKLLKEAPNRHTRLCVEAHGPLESPSVFERHSQLHTLSAYEGLPPKAGESPSKIRVVQTTRVREPLSHYLSYYKTYIAGRTLQPPGSWRSGRPLSEEPARFNVSFLTWSPPNLQSNLLLYPRRSLFLENGHWQPTFAPNHGADGAVDDLASFGEADFTKVSTMLQQMDVVGTYERFAEFATLASQLTGVTPHYRPEREDQHFLPNHHAPLADADVCPDMAACAAHVRAIAPYDHLLWSTYSLAFEARIRREDSPAFRAQAAPLRELPPSCDSDDCWYGGQPGTARCAWAGGSEPLSGQAEPEEQRRREDAASHCAAVASPPVVDLVKLDLFAGGEKNYGPAYAHTQLDFELDGMAADSSRQWVAIDVAEAAARDVEGGKKTFWFADAGSAARKAVGRVARGQRA